MLNVYLDTETDGLLDEATVMHCLVLRDMDSDRVVSCTDSAPPELAAQRGWRPISEGLSLLSEAERIYVHNGIDFDIPVIKKLNPGWTYKGRVIDTLIAARTRWGDIKTSDFARNKRGQLPGNLIGNHRLEAWGYRLGMLKGNYGKKDGAWEVWTPELQDYCDQDTAVGKALVQRIRAARIPREVVETEMELREYLHQQERNGFPFRVDKAIELQAKLSAKREAAAQILRAAYGWWYAPNGKTITPKQGKRKSPIIRRQGKEYVAGCPYTKLKVVEFNPKSTDHVTRILTTRYGWKPTVFNEGDGKPTLDEDTLKRLDFPEKAALLEWLLVKKRLEALAEGKQAWLKLMSNEEPDGGKLTGLFHIHGQVNQNGAVTHRATHKWPNITQVPKVTVAYGVECRELFHVPAGWIQMGADASGLELRCLAHRMAKYDDGAYGKIILEGRNEDGTDIHSVNRNALGLEGMHGRDIAKTFIYAYLYGAGDEMLGSIVAPGASPAKQKKIGRDLRQRFEKNIPALGYLSEAVKAKAKKKGYLRLVDGRRVPVRHEHAALNTLLQGDGAVICKRWIVLYNRAMTAQFGKQGWNRMWAALSWSHDEIQNALRPQIAEEAKVIAVSSIESLTEHFRFRIPLTGEAKLGAAWAQCH